jgi:hypothetical protein
MSYVRHNQEMYTIKPVILIAAVNAMTSIFMVEAISVTDHYVQQKRTTPLIYTTLSAIQGHISTPNHPSSLS